MAEPRKTYPEWSLDFEINDLAKFLLMSMEMWLLQSETTKMSPDMANFLNLEPFIPLYVFVSTTIDT